MMGQMCNKCYLIGGILLLVIGVLFLLQDLGVWNFWDLNWWSVLIILCGVTALASSGCKDCQALRK
jgi:hypothetical protein